MDAKDIANGARVVVRRPVSRIEFPNWLAEMDVLDGKTVTVTAWNGTTFRAADAPFNLTGAQFSPRWAEPAEERVWRSSTGYPASVDPRLIVKGAKVRMFAPLSGDPFRHAWFAHRMDKLHTQVVTVREVPAFSDSFLIEEDRDHYFKKAWVYEAEPPAAATTAETEKPVDWNRIGSGTRVRVRFPYDGTDLDLTVAAVHARDFSAVERGGWFLRDWVTAILERAPAAPAGKPRVVDEALLTPGVRVVVRKLMPAQEKALGRELHPFSCFGVDGETYTVGSVFGGYGASRVLETVGGSKTFDVAHVARVLPVPVTDIRVGSRVKIRKPADPSHWSGGFDALVGTELTVTGLETVQGRPAFRASDATLGYLLFEWVFEPVLGPAAAASAAAPVRERTRIQALVDSAKLLERLTKTTETGSSFFYGPVAAEARAFLKANGAKLGLGGKVC